MPRKPLTIIGLDGACWDILRPWVEKGFLPNFKKIIDSGINSDLLTTIPPITGVALPSLFTGMNPGNTGIFGFLDNNNALISYRSIKHHAIWDYLGGVDIKSCIVGLRITYPPKKINGVMLSGGLLRTDKDDFIQPPGLISIARDYHPRKEGYPTLFKLLRGGGLNDLEKLADELIELTKIQFSIFSKLKNTDEFLFSLLWIENTDLLQHFCWQRQDLILKLYKEIDSLLRDFMEQNPATNLLMMSDHGFEKAPTSNFNVNSWLLKEGLLKADTNVASKTKRKLKAAIKNVISEKLITFHTKRKIMLFLEKVRPNRKKKALARNNAKALVYMKAKKAGIDLAKSRAFANDSLGIHINKNNVENYEALRNDIIAKLADFKDPAGNKIIRAIWKKENLYTGSHMEQIPDVVFITTGDYKVTAPLNDKLIDRIKGKARITGAHDSAYHGIFIACGQNISGQKIEEFKMIDFLPTILSYFNIEVPEHIDGSARMEIFKELDAAKIPQKSEVAGMQEAVSAPYTKKEEEEIKKNLRGLGYLE